MDELDVEDFRHGGANITGLRLIDPDFSRTKDVRKEWNRLNPAFWQGASHKIQVTVAVENNNVR